MKSYLFIADACMRYIAVIVIAAQTTSYEYNIIVIVIAAQTTSYEYNIIVIVIAAQTTSYEYIIIYNHEAWDYIQKKPAPTGPHTLQTRGNFATD